MNKAMVEAIAKEMQIVRKQIDILVRDPRSPGLTGITKTGGADSVDAILDDLTRGIARVVADNEVMEYQSFLRVATGNVEAW